ncbi:hypothetical protein GM3708_3183 [Geminocystis sp. NIES-3708]|uniref:(2Fe-2S) ferredoxin domain-containing protein n=1 Tax=Geminocystis sp. NIES-3708 TaxID=1615909 RepID=UPI0005FC9C9E|nr:(2Fe-2S) ferredoxin domain-containing protein [Geminocystis sp. NIES-3708]BAQ62777.1 hypothetical protein GM3708_3183 [Geminocystis sp. NIES-3708]
MKISPKLLVICKGKSCSKDGANKLLNIIKKYESEEFIVTTQYCFGKCGNGPIIFILPEEKLYENVTEKQILPMINKP